MTLMRFDPFRELDRLSEQTVRTPRALPMEAFRRGDRCIVALDLPGVDSKDVDVTVERNVVMVKTVRHPLRLENDEVLIDERPHGEFSRQFFLGDMLAAGDLTAEFDRGVLVLTIPIAESSKPRKIEVAEQTTVNA
ncbi:Hsp20/alpha crystallin family protein [Lentzea sp. NPDC051213]|uniref:Hsp20/alpha crystallin family protein n=1 Tax=Lentzea sp. NPDC051213 TaxID=3364126 RepID=UPI00379691AA